MRRLKISSVFHPLFQVTSFGKKAICLDSINESHRKEKEKFLVTRWKLCSNSHPHRGRVKPGVESASI